MKTLLATVAYVAVAVVLLSASSAIGNKWFGPVNAALKGK
jgi:hypothetical protein